MTDTDIYDDPDLKPDTDFVKFEEPGDGVKGVVVSVGKHVFDDGKAALKLVIRTETGDRTLTAGQMQLKTKLNEARPVVGDTVDITFTSTEKRAGGKTLKHFDVVVTKGDGSVPDAPDNTEAPF